MNINNDATNSNFNEETLTATWQQNQNMTHIHILQYFIQQIIITEYNRWTSVIPVHLLQGVVD